LAKRKGKDGTGSDGGAEDRGGRWVERHVERLRESTFKTLGKKKSTALYLAEEDEIEYPELLQSNNLVGCVPLHPPT
jgi:hypothetical protein